MVLQSGKHSEHFLSMFDGLLPLEWADRIYTYGITIGRPWGAYVTTSDVLNDEIDEDKEWENDPERAISLLVARRLFFDRGRGFLEGDISKIHGIVSSHVLKHCAKPLNRDCCVVPIVRG